MARAVVTAVAVMVAGVVLAACAGGSGGPVVVTVGMTTIDRATVEHWTKVAGGGGLTYEPSGSGHGTPKEQALGFLISSAWLAGEASRLRLSVSDRDVERVLTERREANGGGEFEESLRAAGRTEDDVRLEIRAEREAAAIRTALARRAAQVTQQEVVAFYRAHRRPFVIAEERIVDLIERLPSASAANSLVDHVGTGARFTKQAFHETLVRTPEVGSGKSEKERLVTAIFAARPGVVSVPMRLSGAWTVFVVRKVRPPGLKSIAEVRSAIVARLASRRRKMIVAAFGRRYEQAWTARTNCHPAYRVPGCAQYRGSGVAGNPFSAK